MVALGILTQYYKVLSEKAIDYITTQEQWIDDIIKALEIEDESQGDEAIDYLIAAKRPPKGPQD